MVKWILWGGFELACAGAQVGGDRIDEKRHYPIMQDRLIALRLRLLSAMGLGLVSGLAADDARSLEQRCLMVDTAGKCPLPDDAFADLADLSDADGCDLIEVEGFPSREGDECCYPIVEDCSDFDRHSPGPIVEEVA